MGGGVDLGSLRDLDPSLAFRGRSFPAQGEALAHLGPRTLVQVINSCANRVQPAKPGFAISRLAAPNQSQFS